MKPKLKLESVLEEDARNSEIIYSVGFGRGERER